ncbi:hypothetical protein LADH09A_005782 [Micromonospora sp. LAH09]|uniref:hypothetical protein n=1 Tax=Micromonospora cabrerizensis TaxID=2911213 RepID=UPI001EE7A147|nr:hypothetical protein [Micromonospora cabrerizensis]MCG5471780.1 hypothetical protein [Micromonospora cabrerizensis]
MTDEREALRAELTAWLLQHAPARLRTIGADPELLSGISLLAITGAARWGDPHWPNRGRTA